MTVVMHNVKQEFQVLDPKYSLTYSHAVVDDLVLSTFLIKTLLSFGVSVTLNLLQKGQIALDIYWTNKTTRKQFPDVETWPIKKYEIGKQDDG